MLTGLEFRSFCHRWHYVATPRFWAVQQRICNNSRRSTDGSLTILFAPEAPAVRADVQSVVALVSWKH